SYNLDSFRGFIQSEGFSEVYDLTTAEIEELKADDLLLLNVGFKLLKQVLFGEMTIPVKGDAMQKRAHKRREEIKADPDDPNKDYEGPELI
ncbi:MAG: hypothetical protein VSS75_000605, partial [Candidatus Parabeggiatoa sp.]|nr:hypothetical protein [Candidatus Parabeggiatoa sp.]